MSYRFTSNHERQKRTNRMALAGTILLVLFLLVIWIFPGGLSSAVVAVGKPFWQIRVFLSSGVSHIGGLFSSKIALVDENKKLSDELNTAYALLSDRALLEQQNISFKELLGRSDAKRLVAAAVLVKPNFSPYDTLIIDAGVDKNVRVGDKVVVGESAVIGDVNEVYTHTAQVVLYSSSGRHLDVALGSSSIPVVAEGRGGGNFLIELPRSTDVKEGDVISLPALGPQVVAIATKIESSADDAFKKVYFTLPINPSELSIVGVLHE